MIDEDLYQQATDELNSDKRRPHIWARACALASDDHDEARYLYTNLRVEELIAQREASGEQPAVTGPAATEESFDSSLSLEPLELEGDDIPESVSAPSGVDQVRSPDDLLTLNAAHQPDEETLATLERTSFQEKFDDSKDLDDADEPVARTEDEPAELALADDYLDETINLTSELDGTAVFELDDSDVGEFDEFENDELPADNPDEILADVLPDPAMPDSAAMADPTAAAIPEEDEMEALLGGIYQGSPPPPPVDPLADDDTSAAMTLEFSDVNDTQAHLDSSSEWLEGELTPEDRQKELQAYASPDSTNNKPLDDTDRLSLELERQANDLPGQRDDIVSMHDDNAELSALLEKEQAADTGDTFDDEADRDIIESLRRKYANDENGLDAAESELAAPEQQQDSQRWPDDAEHDGSNSELATAAAMAASGPLADSVISADSREFPVDLTDQQSGTLYSIFRRDGQTQAVKNGASWPALFLTLPYLVYRHLFGTALVYAFLWLIVVAGLLIAGLAWLDAGSAVSDVVRFGTVGFGVLAIIGLCYLPCRYANQWREEKLEQRGFELVAWTRASSPGKAIAAARRAAILD